MINEIAARPPVANVLWVVWLFLTILEYVIVFQAVLSYFARNTKIYWFLHRITEPLVGLFRPLTKRFVSARFPFDLAPVFALVAIMIVKEIIAAIMRGMMYAAF